LVRTLKSSPPVRRRRGL